MWVNKSVVCMLSCLQLSVRDCCWRCWQHRSPVGWTASSMISGCSAVPWHKAEIKLSVGAWRSECPTQCRHFWRNSADTDGTPVSHRTQSQVRCSSGVLGAIRHSSLSVCLWDVQHLCLRLAVLRHCTIHYDMIVKHYSALKNCLQFQPHCTIIWINTDKKLRNKKRKVSEVPEAEMNRGVNHEILLPDLARTSGTHHSSKFSQNRSTN